MNGFYPFALFCTTGAVYLLTWVYAHRLLHRFCARFPDVAQQEIPYAFERWAHPEKAMFFFRRRAAEVVAQDPSIRRLRQRFIFLSILSLFITVGGFLCIGAIGLLEARK
jgi:hypothetical protein